MRTVRRFLPSGHHRARPGRHHRQRMPSCSSSRREQMHWLCKLCADASYSSHQSVEVIHMAEKNKLPMKGNEAMVLTRRGCWRRHLRIPHHPPDRACCIHVQNHAENRRNVSAGRKRSSRHQHGLRGLCGRRPHHDVLKLSRSLRKARASRIWQAPICRPSSSTCSEAALGLGGIQPSQADYWAGHPRPRPWRFPQRRCPSPRALFRKWPITSTRRSTWPMSIARPS